MFRITLPITLLAIMLTMFEAACLPAQHSKLIYQQYKYSTDHDTICKSSKCLWRLEVHSTCNYRNCPFFFFFLASFLLIQAIWLLHRVSLITGLLITGLDWTGLDWTGLES